MKDDFRVPFMANIPVEVEQKLNEQANREITYLDLKNRRTLKKYMNTSSNLRKVADYLMDYFKSNFLETLSYEQIARDLGFSEEQIKGIVSELAGWGNYPLVFIKTPKKKNHFQLHSKNAEDTERWVTSQSRCIASKEQRLEKTINALAVKRKAKKKIKKKEEIVLKEQNEN
jgi:hypothetical protein